MNEVTVTNSQIAEVDNQIDYKAKAVEWLENMGTQLPKQYQTQFLELCQLYQLNPFKREIYAVGYGNKFNIITGYEVYLKRAERTHKLDGWQCITNGNDTKAKVTIWRKDWSHPFEHEVLMNEVKQNSPIWEKMPTFMMKKVCIEQGMRLCFPDEMGGMPYGEEEVSYDRVIRNDDEPERNITPANEQPAFKVMSDNRQKLQKILENYGDKMRNDVYEDCCNALKGDDENDITDKLNRCYPYLAAKGIQVAV